MMKARRSASNCGASTRARREGGEEGSGRSVGRASPRPVFPQRPAGRRVGRHSPPGWGTWHQLWSHLVGCRTCRRIPGRPVQNMGLAQPKQEDSGGLAQPPTQSPPLLPASFMVSPNITPTDWPGKPPSQSTLPKGTL